MSILPAVAQQQVLAGGAPVVGAITLVAQEAPGTANNDVTFSVATDSIAVGDLLIATWCHRSSTRTATITGSGWTTTLHEFEIGNDSARRALAVAWKVAEVGDVGTDITGGWSAGTTTAGVFSVFRTSTPSGTWALDDSGTTATVDPGASATLATDTVTPTNGEGLVYAAAVFRYGEAGTYSFPGSLSGTSIVDGSGGTVNGRTCQTGYVILTSAAAISDTHTVAHLGGDPVQEIGSWIGAFSVTPGGA